MIADVPIIDIDAFLSDPTSAAARAEADKCAFGLIKYGCLVVKDSRAKDEANDAFLDVMEDYFSQDQEALERDLRPEVGYQVGATLENTERPKCGTDEGCQAVIRALDPAERPTSTISKADAKCRFFWRMGAVPPETRFPGLNMQNVVPEAFKDRWEPLMDGWGGQLLGSVDTVARMLAVGLGIDESTFSQAAEYGSHLLAPTASNLDKYGDVGHVLAGFHTDLNFLTIHGRSRFPGLFVWARNVGKRMAVKVPPGHLLVQAGKQLEHLTGGLVLAGYHEVVVTPATVETMQKRRADPATADRPSIRISSTLFHHLSSDYKMDPAAFRKLVLDKWTSEHHANEEADQYGEQYVGTLVENELKHIALLAS